MVTMSRGWESKSVEEQQQAAESRVAPAQSALSAEDLQRQRRIADLKLQRNRILETRTSNPHRRAALQDALQQVTKQLAELGAPD
jgi:hypothetical protein